MIAISYLSCRSSYFGVTCSSSLKFTEYLCDENTILFAIAERTRENPRIQASGTELGKQVQEDRAAETTEPRL